MNHGTDVGEEATLSAWVDEVADQFEAAWRGLTPPCIDEFLVDAAGARRVSLLLELVKVDAAYRRGLGEKRHVEDYLHEYPELRQAVPFLAREPDASANLPETTSSLGSVDGNLPAIRGYEILNELGRGGMGVVYKARQVGLNRVVALKMLLSGVYAGPQERSRFRAEAEAAARLRHPNIVDIYEVGEQQDRLFCVLEYVEGGSLADRLQGTPQPPRQAAALVETLARAVHYAHQGNVVHRDLKPGNILLQKVVSSQNPVASRKQQWSGSTDYCLLTADYSPKITDFGLAKALDSPARTQTGEILGTPSYMAPEQAEGKSGAVGPTVDIYALGAILYELLTGRPPFRGESTLETLEQVRTQEPLPPSRLQPHLPRDLSTICQKCLQKDPRKRYLSANELADDLRHFLDGKSITARPVGRTEKLWRWCRRNPWVAGLTAGVVFAVLLGTAASTYFLGQAGARAKEMKREQAGARRHAYVSAMHLARPYWETARVDWLQTLLDSQLPEHTGGEDLRGFEWHYWERLARVSGRVSWHHFADANVVAFSSDGGRFAYTRHDGTMRIHDAATGRGILTLTGHGGSLVGAAFSPDGAWLAAGSEDGTVFIWDTADAQLLRTFRGHSGPVNSIVFSPAGVQLASAGGDATVRLWDVATVRALLTLTGHTGGINAMAFSPNAARLATASDDGTVRLWDLETGRERHAFRGHTGKVGPVAFSPDGRRLASGGRDRVVRIWNADDGRQVLALTGHDYYLSAIAFSPDGCRLASASDDRTVRLWDTADGRMLRILRGHTHGVRNLFFSREGTRLASSDLSTMITWDAFAEQESRPLVGHTLPVYGVAFSPDGRWLATSSGEMNQSGGEVILWNAMEGRVVHKLTGHHGGINGVAFSADSKLLASASDDGTVRIWDVTAGEQIRTFTGHTGKVWGAVFSPDGLRVATAGEDGTVRVWDSFSGQELRQSLNSTTQFSGLAYDPNGIRLAAAGWDGRVTIWDSATGREAHTLDTANGVALWSVSFRPDGRRVASVGNDGAVRLWDADSGKLLLTMRGHTAEVSGVAFSPDGRRLATAGWDKTVRIWDAESGVELLTLTGHAAPVFGVAFSPDGHRLASASWDKTVRIWDATHVP